MAEICVGHGFDVHELVAERRLILGGIEIAFEKGLAGHSDADVLTHAIMDALLGAAGLGDIGLHFPPTDVRFADADSTDLLARVMEKITAAGCVRVVNVDVTVMAERPKLKPHIPAMRERLAPIIGLDVKRLNIKATTTEKLGFVGREEGIAASAVCLIELVD
ncbi:MAG TPA: 2-C-methyl-D-erythritol 2,4-cyclodiphosphate synthase [candidate division Zixibacteria bacterium]|nr:2-C-methyl-D-erythritol 2,4-cyclodiphosphate synthase [candidate division Zixibacteria bacterium]